MNAETADNAGTPQLKQFHTVNIDMFSHQKYYKELRKRNKSDQAISLRESETSAGERAPGQGLKQQASSNKRQAPSDSNSKPQASSDKQQASSDKPQASSSKILEPR